MGESDEPTSMHLTQPTKGRFDSLKRQLEAARDEDLTNSEALEIIMDTFEGESDDV